MRSPALAAGPLPRQRTELIGLGEIHAWLADLAGPDTGPGKLPDPARFDQAVLDPRELDRAAGYARSRDGARFAVSRACLRLVLGRYLNADPADLQFTVGAAGQPALAGEHAGRLQFSLSRSGSRALIAVSLQPVGADIELVRPRAGLADLIASRFSAAEAACIRAGCGGGPARGFYRHWTAKEAYLKATGRGLAGLRATELTCGSPPAVVVDGRQAEGWTLSRPEAGPGCATAIVGRGPVTQCRAASQ
jgi:4'-phosphopantetheinyl transferase